MACKCHRFQNWSLDDRCAARSGWSGRYRDFRRRLGTGGFIDGWDSPTGQHLWRTYPVAGPGEPGNETSPGDTWKRGGGPAWLTGSFDPELHTVYWGTGNPSSWNAIDRKGDNLYTCSVLALDPKTGQIKWQYQFSPNDPFDYNSAGEMVFATINVNGTSTKVILHADKNGFFYVLDRTSGKLIAANPFVKVNWASGVDLKTGRPIYTDVSIKARAGEKVTVWPSTLGGKNWGPMSFDPQKGLAYANTLNFGGHYKAAPAEYKAGQFYFGADMSDLWEWPKGPRGYLKAIDPLTGKAKWENPSDLPRYSGVLSTAGGLVFSGTDDGRVRGFQLRQRQEALAIPDRLKHRRSADHLATGWRAVRRGDERRLRGLFAVYRRPAARLGPCRRIALGVRSGSVVTRHKRSEHPATSSHPMTRNATKAATMASSRWRCLQRRWPRGQSLRRRRRVSQWCPVPRSTRSARARRSMCNTVRVATGVT